MAVIGDENAYKRSRLLKRKEQRMVIRRRRIKQTELLEVRLAQEADRLREQIMSLPQGSLRDEVERKVVQIEAACEAVEMLRSPASEA